MATCTQCGAELKPGTKFCENCGAAWVGWTGGWGTAAGCAAGFGADTFAPQFSQNLAPGFNSAPHCVHVAIVSASFYKVIF